MTHPTDGIEALAEELDLLAFPIITGTLVTRNQERHTPVERPIQVGDYILNVRPLKGTTDQYTVMNGRITRINQKNGAYENNRYLGRIDGALGWVTSLVEPHQLLPRIHNALIVITNHGGQATEIPAIYDVPQQKWRSIREGNTISDTVWINPQDIHAFRHARIVTQ